MPITEKLLPESKSGSTSLQSSPHLQAGWRCEEIALKVYQNHGYQILKRRWKTPFAEVDLFLRIPHGSWVIVEVKSLPSAEYLAQRLSLKQKQRLRRVFLWCLENWGPGELHLAVVSQSEVLIFTEIFE